MKGREIAPTREANEAQAKEFLRCIELSCKESNQLYKAAQGVFKEKDENDLRVAFFLEQRVLWSTFAFMIEDFRRCGYKLEELNVESLTDEGLTHIYFHKLQCVQFLCFIMPFNKFEENMRIIYRYLTGELGGVALKSILDQIANKTSTELPPEVEAYRSIRNTIHNNFRYVPGKNVEDDSVLNLTIRGITANTKAFEEIDFNKWKFNSILEMSNFIWSKTMQWSDSVIKSKAVSKFSDMDKRLPDQQV